MGRHVIATVALKMLFLSSVGAAYFYMPLLRSSTFNCSKTFYKHAAPPELK
jgi:hypothetical protein